MKRSGKFYRNNEAEVMKILGLEPTIGSGSGWIEKEDGQSDSVICQLKSTDAASIRIKREDIFTLEYNAEVAHKIPVFAIQFLDGNDVFLLMRPENLEELAKHLNTGEKPNDFFDLDVSEQFENEGKVDVKSSAESRRRLERERKKRYERNRSAL